MRNKGLMVQGKFNVPFLSLYFLKGGKSLEKGERNTFFSGNSSRKVTKFFATKKQMMPIEW